MPDIVKVLKELDTRRCMVESLLAICLVAFNENRKETRYEEIAKTILVHDSGRTLSHESQGLSILVQGE